MAYDSPFQPLTPNVVHLLSADYNSELRGMYIDCLAVLQGFLGRFSSDPIVSVFDDAESVDNIIEELLSRMPSLLSVSPSADTTTSSRSQLQEKADLLREFMIATIRSNKQIAIDLYRECISPKKAITYQAAFNLVDVYLNALVTQYRFLRYPNTQPLILQAGR